MHRKAVVDFSLAVSITFRRNIRSGRASFTSRSSSAGVDPDAKNNINTDDINKYGVSMSIGVLARQMESNIGLIYLYGSGDTYGTEVVNNQRVATRTDVKENHLYLMLNTIYRF
jgi:hypothetical protein